MSGSGSTGNLAKFTGASAIGDSIVSESSTVLTVANTVNAVSGFQVNGVALAASHLSNATTGTGNVVLAGSPTLTTPALGTPTALVLTNATALPLAAVSGLGAGVATFLATPSSVNLATAVSDETGTGALVFANSPTLVTPALGTPTALVLTSATGLPLAAVTGLGTGVATWLATPSSANLATAITDETGSGALVFAISPTLVSPTLGAAVGTTLAVGGTLISGTTVTVVSTASSTPRGITSAQFSTDVSSARITCRKTRGTQASPSTIVTGDFGANWSTEFYDGTTFVESASVRMVSEGTIGTGRTPTYIAFMTNTDATTSALTERLRIDSAGLSSFTGTVKVSSLTATRLVYSGTAGLLQDSAGLTYSDASNIRQLVLQSGSSQSTTGLLRFNINAGTEGASLSSLFASNLSILYSSVERINFVATGINVFNTTAGLYFNSDTGLSRVSAGTVGVGSGAAGSTAGSLTATTLTATGNLTLGSIAQLRPGGSDGIITLTNPGLTGFTRLNIGGANNSFSAIGYDAVNGITFQSGAGTTTWNDNATANSGTVANRYTAGIAAPALSSTGTSVTYTVASTLYVGGAPTAGTNVTIGTAYSIISNGGTVLFSGTRTITGTVSDGVEGALISSPTYTAATAQTVTRHNYLKCVNVAVAGVGPAAVTNACLAWFDAAAGTHKAVDGATTKVTVGAVDAWVKINVNGSILFMPAYTSKTA